MNRTAGYKSNPSGNKPVQYETGVIHGRFQVLHNDHLKYMLAGKELCRHLVVGITNPDPLLTRWESADPDRDNLLANPLSFYERYVLVNAVLREAGISCDDFSVVPLPINLPQHYKFYAPMDAVFFLTIYDDWGRKKLSYFNSLGLATHILWEVSPDKKGISGSQVRKLMLEKKPWEHMVPPSVSVFMKKWDIPKRLQNASRFLGDSARVN